MDHAGVRGAPLRFLHRDDLMEMGITHLHVTDALAEALTPKHGACWTIQHTSNC